jgi:hypothetical protein
MFCKSLNWIFCDSVVAPFASVVVVNVAPDAVVVVAVVFVDVGGAAVIVGVADALARLFDVVLWALEFLIE